MAENSEEFALPELTASPPPEPPSAYSFYKPRPKIEGEPDEEVDSPEGWMNEGEGFLLDGIGGRHIRVESFADTDIELEIGKEFRPKENILKRALPFLIAIVGIAFIALIIIWLVSGAQATKQPVQPQTILPLLRALPLRSASLGLS